MKFRSLGLLTTAATMLLVASLNLSADHHESPFASKTIDIGVVVSDVKKTVKFYTEALGFKEVPGFSVPAGFSKNVGLTDNAALKIRVLILGEGEGATKLKVMELPGVKSRKSENRFIHSQLGFSYLTISVKDTTAALKRLEKAGIKPIAGGTQELPEPLPQGVYLTIVRDPDGNLVELVGPKS
jgi:lactoylglutathione lyase